MSKTQIDGAGLLLAALAALLALSVLSGPLAWLGSIAGLVLIFILLSYDREGYRSSFESLAFSAVFGLCLTVASAVLWRYVAASQNRPATFEGVVGTEWLPLFWVGVTLLFIPIDRARMSGRVQQPLYASASPLAAPTLIPHVPAPSPPLPPTYRPTPMPIAPPIAPTPPAPPQQAAFTRPTFSQPEPEPPPQPLPPPAPVYATPPPPIRAPEAPPVVGPAAAVPEPPPPTVPPIPPGREATIYVTLVDEGLNVLRAVRAENLGHDFYRIAEEMPPGETWQYGPNQVVRCKKKNLSSGKAMVAIEEAPRAR